MERILLYLVPRAIEAVWSRTCVLKDHGQRFERQGTRRRYSGIVSSADICILLLLSPQLTLDKTHFCANACDFVFWVAYKSNEGGFLIKLELKRGARGSVCGHEVGMMFSPFTNNNGTLTRMEPESEDQDGRSQSNLLVNSVSLTHVINSETLTGRSESRQATYQITQNLLFQT